MKSKASTAFVAFLLAATSFIVFAAPVAAGPTVSYTVSVGYADDLRAAPNFPSPWCGGANVALFASVGDSLCAGSGAQWDSGAIMITNTGATSFTINTLTLVEPNDWCGSGGCTIWGAYLPFVLAPGKSAIFAQTSGENFDTSDFGLPGIGPSLTDNCNAGAEQGSATCVNNTPTVEVTVNSVQSDFKDVGFVTDTGGFDSVNSNPCPDNGNPNSSGDQPGACNESLQWRDISSTCGVTCPGGGGNPIPGVPEFSLPVAVITAIGLLALALVRKATLPRISAPGTQRT
jgi:hypothetical protein